MAPATPKRKAGPPLTFVFYVHEIPTIGLFRRVQLLLRTGGIAGFLETGTDDEKLDTCHILQGTVLALPLDDPPTGPPL